MQLDLQFIDKINRIDWFANCGKDVPSEYGIKVKSYDEALKNIIPVTSFWENLLKIYEAGYLPCGWKGKKSEGKFYILNRFEFCEFGKSVFVEVKYR